jgi:primosomal protein N'
MPIARVALPVAAPATFDYWVPDGSRSHAAAIVRVTLGTRRMTGVVADVAAESAIARENLLPIVDVVDGLVAA